MHSINSHSSMPEYRMVQTVFQPFITPCYSCNMKSKGTDIKVTVTDDDHATDQVEETTENVESDSKDCNHRQRLQLTLGTN